MPHTLGKTLAVATLSLVSAIVIIYAIERTDPARSLIESTALGRSGIKDLDVEYVDGKIYLNIELNTPKTCNELVDSLKIQTIVIKRRTYQPTCMKISDTLMRVTYTQSISI